MHTSKRVHNDLKPENVMIKTLEDGSTQAFLIDYGFVTKYYGANYSHIGEINHILASGEIDEICENWWDKKTSLRKKQPKTLEETFASQVWGKCNS